MTAQSIDDGILVRFKHNLPAIGICCVSIALSLVDTRCSSLAAAAVRKSGRMRHWGVARTALLRRVVRHHRSLSCILHRLFGRGSVLVSRGSIITTVLIRMWRYLPRLSLVA